MVSKFVSRLFVSAALASMPSYALSQQQSVPGAVEGNPTYLVSPDILPKYVIQNYPRLVDELKQEYDFPFLRGLPQPGIEFYVLGDGRDGAKAYYDPDEKIIFISFIWNMYIDKDNQLKPGDQDVGAKYLDETLKHEYVHYYAHSLSEKIGNGRFPVEKKDEIETYLEMLKCEGISEVLVPSSRRVHNFADDDWQNISIDSIKPRSPGFDMARVYPAAYNFAKPIIDKYGEAGIVAIIKSKSKAEYIHDVPGWRNRILDRLEKGLFD